MTKVMDISTEGEHVVHPIDSRYRVPEMNAIWEEENQLQKMLEVEVAIAESISEIKSDLISPEEAKDIKENIGKVKLKRVKEIEAEIHHDIMAVVKGLAEVCKIGGGKIHLGATSADITETAKAMLMKESLELIIKDTTKLRDELLERARQTMDLVCIDRTHGQHATPSTYGFIFAGYADQVGTAISRLEYDLENYIVGKMSGAVGTANTYRDLGLDGIELEKIVLSKLGLRPAFHSRQVPPRDNLMFVFSDLTVLAIVLEKIASDFWNLGRTEIKEVMEATSPGQVGSSTMPHKKNPFRLERIMGMASILRGNLMTELELSFTHARDLKQSAADRFKIPEIFVTLDYMLRLQTNIVKYMLVMKENVKKNLYLTKGSVMAERIMTELARKGMDRQKAHEKIKQLAWEAVEKDKMLVDLLSADSEITGHLSNDKIHELMNPETYIGYAKEKTRMILDKYGGA